MNWINTHPAAGRDEPLGTPVSSMTVSNDTAISQREGWIGARIESYRMRREFIQQIVLKLKVFVQ